MTFLGPQYTGDMQASTSALDAASPSLSTSTSFLPGDVSPAPAGLSKKRKTVADSSDGPAPKKKKKDPSVPGPGKNWRKGLKGSMTRAAPAADGVPTAAPSVPLTVEVKKEKKPRAPRPKKPKVPAGEDAHNLTADLPAASLVVQAPRANTGFLPIQAFLPKAPPPRKWPRSTKTILNVMGKELNLAVYIPESSSALARVVHSLKAQAAALQDDREGSEDPEAAYQPKATAKRGGKKAKPDPAVPFVLTPMAGLTPLQTPLETPADPLQSLVYTPAQPLQEHTPAPAV